MLQTEQKQALPFGTWPTAVLGVSGLHLPVGFILELNHFIWNVIFSVSNLGHRKESGDDWVLVEEKKFISQQLTALESLSSRSSAYLGHMVVVHGKGDITHHLQPQAHDGQRGL